jgi:hypothetical protein
MSVEYNLLKTRDLHAAIPISQAIPSTGKRIMSDTSGLDEIRILRENEYDRRVEALEDEGLTRSDAQGVVDAEDLKKDLKAGF